MAALKFIVKFFPEITIKSKPVRRQFVTQLAKNLRRVLREIDPGVEVHKDWDKLVVTSELEPTHVREQFAEAIGRVAGISRYLDVLEFPLGDFDDILRHARGVYEPRLPGKTFAVRCKRAGRHAFRSVDVERFVGGGLVQHCDTAGVNLGNPDVTVGLEIRDDRLYVINQGHQGLGGYPVGSLDPVLSLISGGFDSTVASYLTMKRGIRTHFCFFNLGGRDHELGVKEVALYLWMKYGCGQRVRFVSVPFEEVVAELLNEVEDSQMGVILKRMMLRAATQVADQLSVDALVTGESIAQVSSQTLRNLSVIDAVTEKLVLRPLITSDKEAIIALAKHIGTEAYAAAMPEYCGIISVNPTTRARPERIAAQEAHFDLDIIDRAVAAATVQNIDEIAEEELSRTDVEVLQVPLVDAVIIDIRHPDEVGRLPLQLRAKVLNIPFYELHSRLQALDPGQTYMLYCDQGVMSKLHAGHLVASGFNNVKVYRPQA
jgi:thiamine biosynthesis protein ThiI